MRFRTLHIAGTGAALLLGTIAAASARQDAPQDASQEIVIEGKRDQQRVQGGEWRLHLSRAYHFGAGGALPPMGKDKEFRFCLADTDVAPLMRILVGEGRTQSSGTTTCSPLVIQLGDGRLQATQHCHGGNMDVVDSTSGASSTVPAKNTLSVTGHYAPTSLTIDFADSQERVTPETARPRPIGQQPGIEMGSRPSELRWSIQGERVGTCQPKGAANAPAPAH